MNTGQMMLTICGLVLLSTLILNMNRNYDYSSTSIAKNRFDVQAIEVAQAYLEDIKNSKRIYFDQNTMNSMVNSPSGLSTIGKDGSESRLSDSTYTYNDVDDFNNDTKSVKIGTAKDSTRYFLKCQVQYFDSTGSVTASRTFHKKVTVMIVSSHVLSADTIRLSTIISYWKFR